MLAPIFAGTFVALLDLSIVIVALPTIQHELSTDVTGAQWVVDRAFPKSGRPDLNRGPHRPE